MSILTESDVYFEQAHGDHSHEYPISLVKESGEWKIAGQ